MEEQGRYQRIEDVEEQTGQVGQEGTAQAVKASAGHEGEGEGQGQPVEDPGLPIPRAPKKNEEAEPVTEETDDQIDGGKGQAGVVRRGGKGPAFDRPLRSPEREEDRLTDLLPAHEELEFVRVAEGGPVDGDQ